MISSVPDWNISGVLPPIRPNASGHSSDRSPYKVQMTGVIERFAFNQQRIEILKGLLKYRAELYKLGINKGFQWLNGSFAQHVELTDARTPNDIDVVTFFELPPDETQETLGGKCAHLFTPDITKQDFFVDAYAVILGECLQSHQVGQIAYWYSMWSHRTKDNLWKGFVQVELSPEQDALAIQLLIEKEAA